MAVSSVWPYLSLINKRNLVYYLEGANWSDKQENQKLQPIKIPSRLYEAIRRRSGRAPITHSGKAVPGDEDPDRGVGTGWYAYPKTWRELLYDPERMQLAKRCFHGCQT